MGLIERKCFYGLGHKALNTSNGMASSVLIHWGWRGQV